MKPSIPRGTRDFGPAEMQKRNYIFSVIRKNFELFGYESIETPTMENIETLTGKYGDEGDQLIFKILNSRIHKSKEKDKLQSEFEKSLASSHNSVALTEKALRYDLTVPFARYVVMHQNEITFPFKRYQIQPVWRADKPQKGRYREFYQCDADIIGSDSLVNELDLISLIDKTFSELNVPVLLKINNRKILAALAEISGQPDKIIDIAVAIDKFDKIGQFEVIKELKMKGFSDESLTLIGHILVTPRDIKDSLSFLKNYLSKSEIGVKGIKDLEYIFDSCEKLNLSSNTTLRLDISLARGLNYYTGTIFEVKANAGTFTPSILGGGRYDDLTGIFGLKDMSGVGISFGVDRIYDVMDEMNLFPESISKISSTKLLFAHFDEANRDYCIGLANELRNNNISCEVYPDVTKKVAKQFDYANKKNIPFVCVIGSNEMQNKRYALKDMLSGTQEELSLEEIIKKLK